MNPKRITGAVETVWRTVWRLTGVRVAGGALALAALVTLTIPTAATASTPLHIRTTVDLTIPLPGLSAFCGFPILRRVEGVVDATLFLDGEGNPVHEIDTSPSLRNTFFSPVTGKSVSYPGTGTLITDYYPDGTAVATQEGFLTFIQVPGGRPLYVTVGRVVFTAIVIGTNSDGVPIISPPIDILFEAGVEQGSVLEACAALAP